MSASKREVEAWKKTRTRVGVQEFVEYSFEIPGIEPVEVKQDRRGRAIYVYPNDHLHCHCSGCDHTYQFECDPDRDPERIGCRCCHQMCT